MRKLPAFVGLVVSLATVSGFTSWYVLAEGAKNIPARLDLEQKGEKGSILYPSTQSVNRYSSVLSTMTVIKGISLSENETKLSISIGPEKSEGRVHLRNVDYYQLVPILPYSIAASGPNDFHI